MSNTKRCARWEVKEEGRAHSMQGERKDDGRLYSTYLGDLGRDGRRD